MAHPPRKTYPIKALVNITNQRLALRNTTVEARWALIGLLESVLQEVGAYHGFNYQASEWLDDHTGLRPNHDDTRRVYYYR
jgi:hypothetical protein